MSVHQLPSLAGMKTALRTFLLSTITTTIVIHLARTPGSPLPQAFAAVLASGKGVVSVQDAPYNARGDGTTDDTAAFQQALNDVGALGGGVVFAPTGNYLIASHLTVPAYVSLAGVFEAPEAFSQNKGTTLLAVEGAGSTSGPAFITLQGPDSTLQGVTVFYPNQRAANPPVAYPWTVQCGGGDDIAILDCLLANPYDAVDFASNPSPRHMIRGLYGQPLDRGIQVDQCYDIGRIKNVHFWPFWSSDPNLLAYVGKNAFSFVFLRTDWEIVEDVFSWGYHVGAYFNASSHGAMNGQMSNVNFDNVDVGLDVYQTQVYAIHVSNLNIANAGNGATKIGIFGHAGGSAQLDVRGASFWGSLEQAVSWSCGGLVSLSDARVLQWDSAKPAVSILGGRAMLHDNFFQDALGTAIQVANADRVMITNNQLTGNKLDVRGALTLVANNQP